MGRPCTFRILPVEYIRIYGFYRWILPVEYRVRPLSTYGGVTGTGEFCHLQSLVDCKYTLKVYERAAAEAAPAERFIQSKGHYFFFLAPGERNLPRSFRLPRSSPPSPCRIMCVTPSLSVHTHLDVRS